MTREDIPLLGKLFLEAYFGTVDYEGESEQEAIEAVQATFDGEFGEFIEASSLVIEHSGRLTSAAFVTLWQGQPLLAFSVTAPEYKGQGFAGQCIAASMRALAAAGYRELHLFVTSSNASALSVYNRLGFSVASAA
jgi:GNAT superfamily N-acetyltransferase